MVEDVVARRKKFARDLKNVIRGSTECRDEFGVVLEALHVVAELLEIGKLSGLHSRLLPVKRHVRFKSVHSDMRSKHKLIRKELGRMAEAAKTSARDRELWELQYALDLAGNVLGIHPAVKTLLPERKTKVTTRDFFHYMVTEGAKEIRQTQTEVDTEVIPKAA